MAMTGSLYRGTPRLGGVWQFQPALPAEKGTPRKKPAPPAPIILLCALDSGDRGPGQSRPRLLSESQNTRTLSMVLATTPKAHNTAPTLQEKG